VALIFGCKRNSNSASAIMTPVAPRRKSPLTPVNEIPDNLCGDDYDCESPPPKAASEPPDSRRGEGRAQQKKQNSDGTAQRREPLVRYRSENPDAIKRCPWRKKSDCGETRDGRTKEQENAYRRESSRLAVDSGLHALNISGRSSPDESIRKTGAVLPT